MRHDVQVRLLKELLVRKDSDTNVDTGGFRKNLTFAYRATLGRDLVPLLESPD